MKRPDHRQAHPAAAHASRPSRAGQKVVAVIGTGALLLAGVMVFRWASTPDYAPLFSNLAAADASAVVDQLDAAGRAVPAHRRRRHRHGAAATTSTRPGSSSAARACPAGSDGGYSLLDKQDLSTSQFQEQTDFKRAMEGELAKTIEAIDGVDSRRRAPRAAAEAGLRRQAGPAHRVGARRTPAPARTLGPEQVQAVVHLVASSIDGLDPEQGHRGRRHRQACSPTSDGIGGAVASTRDQQVTDFQDQTAAQVQALLDRVARPGQLHRPGDRRPQLRQDRRPRPRTYIDDPTPNGLPSSTTQQLREVHRPGRRARPPAASSAPTAQMDTTDHGRHGRLDVQQGVDRPRTTRSTPDRRAAARPRPAASTRLHVGVVARHRAAAARSTPAGRSQKLITAAARHQHQARRHRRRRPAHAVRPHRGEGGRRGARQGRARPPTPRPHRMHDVPQRRASPCVVAARPAAGLVPRPQAPQAARGGHDVRRRAAAQRRRADRGALDRRDPRRPRCSAWSAADAAEDDVRDELAALVERQPEDVAAAAARLAGGAP